MHQTVREGDQLRTHEAAGSRGTGHYALVHLADEIVIGEVVEHRRLSSEGFAAPRGVSHPH